MIIEKLVSIFLLISFVSITPVSAAVGSESVAPVSNENKPIRKIERFDLESDVSQDVSQFYITTKTFTEIFEKSDSLEDTALKNSSSNVYFANTI